MQTQSDSKLDLIFGRRSVRVYSPGEIHDATVTRLLEAAMAAPSAMTKDPWRFIVVRNQGALEDLATSLPGGKMLATAALSIIVAGDLESAFESNIGYLLQDCSAATENLLLAAHALGLGACWVGVYPSTDSMACLRKRFALPPQVVPVAVIALGLPGEQLPARTRYQDSNVHREKW